MKFIHRIPKLYDLLITGYTGGAVDVYVPTNPFGTKVWCYAK